jgi:hypothetical protein
MVPYSPGSVSDIGQQLKEAMVFGKSLPTMDGFSDTPGKKDTPITHGKKG